MNVQVVSDIHTEFGSLDYLLEKMDPEGVDVLVIAGDAVTIRNCDESLDAICKLYVKSKVLMVAGNHEYYGSSLEEMQDRLYAIENRNKNFAFLNNRVVELDIGGHKQRFVGTTMWFPNMPGNNYKSRYMNDFKRIKDFYWRVYSENREAQAWLDDNVQEDDFVITHHSPSSRSINSIYRDSDMNCFYVCEMEDLIRRAKPAVWVHGHMHNNNDYVIERTRVLSNPFGYFSYEENKTFDFNLRINL